MAAFSNAAVKDLIRIVGRVSPPWLKQAVKQSLGRQMQLPSMEWSLRRLRELGFRPSAVVDIGAFQGDWTRMAHAIFPEARFLMVEAQPNQQRILESAAEALGRGVSVRMALLGPEAREGVTLHQYDHAATAASVLPDPRSSHSRVVTCRMVTLDELLGEACLPAPGLLKLDVQGFELEVLKGARMALGQTEVVLLEVSLLALYQGNPLLHDVTTFMHHWGFCAYDVCSLLRRPLDDALCQMDILFVRENSALRACRDWV